jgi:hypothetical protein
MRRRTTAPTAGCVRPVQGEDMPAPCVAAGAAADGADGVGAIALLPRATETHGGAT